MSLSICSVYGNPRYTYRPAHTVFAQDGNTILSQDSGYRFRFRSWGKRLDPDTGEIISGIRRPGLAQSMKARRNRAQAELILSEAVEDLRLHGYPEITERDVLQWFLKRHGGTRGIDWNVYWTESGSLVTDEELNEIPEQVTRTFPDLKEEELDDSEFFIHDKVHKEWSCKACDVGPKKRGGNGHRLSKAHRANVERLLQERLTASVAAPA